ncbi:MAG: efflux RND transporter periplasmic adaptor subunit [Planctomycetes bacterium]|nr:efflux RND transporter periplasmic adaptor subunit [Planctomycetota bacterium]
MSETQDQGTTKRDETAKSQSAAPSNPPPRGPSLKVLLVLTGAMILSLCIGLVVAPYITSASTGDLDIAQRVLKRLKSAEAIDEATYQLVIESIEAQRTKPTDESQYYTCGMHPWVVLPKPGDCPICHMDLVPLDRGKFTGEIAIDPVVVQNIGVRIEPVVTGPVTRVIRTVGTVAYDETRMQDTIVRVDGQIETLYANYIGMPVKKGDVLADYHSPTVMAAEHELLIASKSRATADGARIIEAAKDKLRIYGVPDADIEAVLETGKVPYTFRVLSPLDGFVHSMGGHQGHWLTVGEHVNEIIDLSRIWVLATLYEYHLPFVEVGQPAVMTLSYLPGRTFQGKVIYIYPYLDKKTRQINVRLEFDNPTGLLKPGMYANIKLQSTLAQSRTLVPRAAVMDTGKRQIVFVSLGEGRFEPRDVHVGVETDDGMIEILDGLMPGEMVVTSGQFLLDSEANIREALAKMIKGQPASEQEAVGVVAGPSQLSALPDAAADAIVDILDGYFAIGDTFAGDSVGDLSLAAGRIAGAVDVLLDVEIPDDEEFWRKHDEAATVRGIALKLVDQTDLEQARLQFADLSTALAKLIKATGVPPSYPTQVQQLHCPMYQKDTGGSIWLQPKGDVRNPFYGSMMLNCFDVRTVLPVTGPQEPRRNR